MSRYEKMIERVDGEPYENQIHVRFCIRGSNQSDAYASFPRVGCCWLLYSVLLVDVIVLLSQLPCVVVLVGPFTSSIVLLARVHVYNVIKPHHFVKI